MKIAVFGAGTMGSGIAQVFAGKGHTVLLYASSKESAQRHKDKLEKSLQKRVAKGKMAEDAMKNILDHILIEEEAAAADVDLLIETVAENMETKKKLGSQLAQVVYEGKWFTPLREAIQAFVESTQKYVTGEVKFKLYKGNIIKAGTTSPYSLYNESLASFTTGDMYDHHDADGFITLFGLPLKVRAMKLLEVEQNKNNK